jgi:hypothetical protein
VTGRRAAKILTAAVMTARFLRNFILRPRSVAGLPSVWAPNFASLRCRRFAFVVGVAAYLFGTSLYFLESLGGIAIGPGSRCV